MALLVAGLGLVFIPGLASSAIEHAMRFVDRPALARETLHDVPPPPLPAQRFHVAALSYAYGVATALATLGFAWLGLYRRRLPTTLRRVGVRSVGPAINRIKLLHDGVVGEYVTWLAFGAAGLAGVFALVLR